MDIDLLSKMVKELILDNDRVVLPGFGAFVAEIVPSTFSDKGYTINPPYRKLFFRMKPEEDIKLIEFYASSNDVELAVANKVIRDFVEELKSVLFTRKTVVFPGLGRLRATKENTVFFVADEDLDIYPEGFALEPISLKTHEETKEEIADAVAGLKAIVSEPVPVVEPEPTVEPEPVAEPEPAVQPETPTATSEPQVDAEPEPQIAVEDKPKAEPVVQQKELPTTAREVEKQPKKKRSGWKAFWVTIIVIVALAILLFAGFMAVAHWAPHLLDTILYTPEELEILNYQ